MSGPGFLMTTVMSSSPDPFSERLIAVGGGSSTRSSGGRVSVSVTRCSETARRLPVRSRNGTPRQRSVSTQSRAAMNVSVSESSAMPSTSR